MLECILSLYFNVDQNTTGIPCLKFRFISQITCYVNCDLHTKRCVARKKCTKLCLRKYMDIPFETDSIRNPTVNISLVAVRYDQVILCWGVALGTATCCGLDGPGIESRWGTRLSAPVQTVPGDKPAFCATGTGSLSWG